MRNAMPWYGLLMLAVSVAAGQGYIGRLDTIGSTTYDWQNGWHAVKCLVNAPGHGLHATWICSFATTGTDFTDRNQRYNYCDFTTRRWSFQNDSSPLLGGINPFLVRTGNGNVDYDPDNGAAIIASHRAGTGRIVTITAKDTAPGAAIFAYADGEQDIGITQWPRLAVGQNGTVHLFSITTDYNLTYDRILPDSWPNFAPPRHFLPSPGFPTFNIAASKVSGKVCLIWEISTNTPEDAYITTSTDDGATWQSPWDFVPPAAFGGDTATAFHITSLYPYYDFEDRLHVVTSFVPTVNDTTYPNVAQLWHWCPDNNPEWTRIHIATWAAGNWSSQIGYNATYAGRPSLGDDGHGNLFVAWEQFDSSNVEVSTNRLRAGIWLSGSADNGLSWTSGELITERNTYSHRFPSIVDRIVPGDLSGDTVCVLYMIDSLSGFYVQSEGPASHNPIVCQFVIAPRPGIEQTKDDARRTACPGPTIVRGVILLPRFLDPSITPCLLDISGRSVLNLHTGANDVSCLSPGVYFCRLTAGSASSAQASGAEHGASHVTKVVLTE